MSQWKYIFSLSQIRVLIISYYYYSLLFTIIMITIHLVKIVVTA